MSLKNKNVFITGISGFVGSYMAKHLLNEGANVFGIDKICADSTTLHNIKHSGIVSKINILEGDIQDISSIASALDQSKPDIVFHFAAQSFIPESFCSPSETMEVNCLGTSNLLEAIRSKGLDPVIVFAGSSDEYGLVFVSDSQYQRALKKYGTIFPLPATMPELPVIETN